VNEYNHLERSLLILLLENHSVFLDFEWHLMVPENAKGKLHYFFMRQLNVGTKGLQKILRELRKKGLVHRDDMKRGRSFAMRYLLTPRGRLLANELLKERIVYPVQKESFMRVLVKSEDEQTREEPLFAIKGGAIVSIDSVAIKKETQLDPISQEYVLVKEDVLIVTKQVSDGVCKIVVKGLELEIDPIIYEKAKRICKVTEACENFEYCLQTPLSEECFSSITVLKQGTHTKKILKEWKTKVVDTD
jgi:predicted transcriptional regulator